ncbi:hypothetical protein AURDEDRAFT_164131 [Auricularia subglabra TFB-10046 SS5]|nr:hypothetical protein AURDEDRAFT_164131 [Auricularia subglabra TFB-10046 SS5]
MRFAALASALALAAHAYALTAWSGNTCDGARGNSVPNDGSCRSFGGRHSFNAEGDACVEFFTAGGCNGQKFTYYDQGNRCTNVNTGTDIQSFRAWSGRRGCPDQGELPTGPGGK